MPSPAPVSELLTAEELAGRLKISPHTVRLWSTEGKIPTVWLSRTVRRFDFGEVLEALRESSDTIAGREAGR